MSNADDAGRLILRLALGLLVLLHGIAKLQHGVGGIIDMVQGAGLPGVFAYAVFLGEIVGPVLLIVGWYARIGALLIAVNMLVALALVHTGQFFLLKANGGYALELQTMYLLTAVVLALIGPGRFGINRK